MIVRNAAGQLRNQLSLPDEDQQLPEEQSPSPEIADGNDMVREDAILAKRPTPPFGLRN
jgi:hypothetical protein